MKGLLEQAGHQVFNPTLPFHTPYDHWSWIDGQMTVQKYVDVYIQVSSGAMNRSCKYAASIKLCCMHPVLSARSKMKVRWKQQKRGACRNEGSARGSITTMCAQHVRAFYNRHRPSTKESAPDLKDIDGHLQSCGRHRSSRVCVMGVQVIVLNNLQNVVLVGHSLAGVWMQMPLQQIPNRIASMMFIDAAVLLPGESFFSNRIGGVVSTLPMFPVQVPLPSTPNQASGP